MGFDLIDGVGGAAGKSACADKESSNVVSTWPLPMSWPKKTRAMAKVGEMASMAVNAAKTGSVFSWRCL
jgi:hypothetical protein